MLLLLLWACVGSEPSDSPVECPSQDEATQAWALGDCSFVERCWDRQEPFSLEDCVASQSFQVIVLDEGECFDACAGRDVGQVFMEHTDCSDISPTQIIYPFYTCGDTPPSELDSYQDCLAGDIDACKESQ